MKKNLITQLLFILSFFLLSPPASAEQKQDQLQHSFLLPATATAAAVRTADSAQPMSSALLAAATPVDPAIPPSVKNQTKQLIPKSRVRMPGDQSSVGVKHKPASRSVSASALPPPEGNSFDFALQKSCATSGFPCWLVARIHNVIANATLDYFTNVNPSVHLWFPYPGSSERDAPRATHGFMVPPGARIDPLQIGFPTHFPLISPVSVAAIPYCLQNGQLQYCEHEQAFLRLHYQ